MDKKILFSPNEPPKKSPTTEELSFLRGGSCLYGDSNPRNKGNSGYYWESKIDNITNARRFDFHSASLAPQGYNNGKGYGLSVRCVAR